MNDYKHLANKKTKHPDTEWVHCLITVFMVWAVMHCIAVGL